MSDIFQLTLCLEFSQFGIDPNLIVKTVQRNWAGTGYLKEAIGLAQRFPETDFWVVVSAAVMSAPWSEIPRSETKIVSYSPLSLHFYKSSDWGELLEMLSAAGQRAMVFNLSSRVRAVEAALIEEIRK